VDTVRQADGSVGVNFNYDEALVLSDLLSRWVDKERLIDQLHLDQAERRVLFDLTASFEPMIDGAYTGDYDQVVERARAALRYPPE
jgi:hypothetical protein